MTELPLECYQVKQIRQLEQLAMDELGLSESQLMGRAGQAAYHALIAAFPEVESIAVFCGKGNNGGDGYVLASLAAQAGLAVTVYTVGDDQSLPSAAAQARDVCRGSGVVIEPFSSEISLEAIDVVVDAILGIGLQGDVRDPAKQAIEFINRSGCAVFAIDAPSGMDANTGVVLGCAVEANVTITFIGLKQGLLTHEGLDFCGELLFDALDLDERIYEQVAVSAFRLDWFDRQLELTPRRRHAHKGDFGHVLVVGGDHGMAGAVRMAAEAALRVGAGLVSVATHPQHLSAIIDERPEIMCHGVTQADELTPLLAKATVVVVGPGLGQSAWSQALWQAVLACPLPLIVDASALVLLAQNPSQRDNWIITPHPGEAARLLASDSQTIQTDRFAAAVSLQQRYHGTVILKGAGTIVQTPDNPPDICDAGNPGMASGGMGDVLSGVLAGLVAQGFTLPEAAQLAVTLHATAGDSAAATGGERGLLATDVIAQLRRLVNPELE